MIPAVLAFFVGSDDYSQQLRHSMVRACTVAHHIRKAGTYHCKGRTRELQKNSAKNTSELFEELPRVLVI